MRVIPFVIIILVIQNCAFQEQKKISGNQTAAELSYEKYFNRNYDNIDKIEGIWYEYAVGSLYKDRVLLQRIREPNRATWIIIKDEDSNGLIKKELIMHIVINTNCIVIPIGLSLIHI
mgnify:CR=1 FL=1